MNLASQELIENLKNDYEWLQKRIGWYESFLPGASPVERMKCEEMLHSLRGEADSIQKMITIVKEGDG